jgi:hypothetical protein
VNGITNGNGLNVSSQANGINVTGTKRRNSAQNETQGGIKFLQRAMEET